MRLGLFLAAFAFSAILLAQTTPDVQRVLQRDFKARGQATMDRVVQDGVQRVCTESDDRPPAALAKQMEADQMKTIAFPEGSLIGDWKKGEGIAQSGRGGQWTDPAGAAPRKSGARGGGAKRSYSANASPTTQTPETIQS